MGLPWSSPSATLSEREDNGCEQEIDNTDSHCERGLVVGSQRGTAKAFDENVKTPESDGGSKQSAEVAQDGLRHVRPGSTVTFL